MVWILERSEKLHKMCRKNTFFTNYTCLKTYSLVNLSSDNPIWTGGSVDVTTLTFFCDNSKIIILVKYSSHLA